MANNWMQNHRNKKKSTRKYQMGGAAPAPGQEMPQDPGMGGNELDAMIQEYAQTRDPNLAVAIADMIVEMMAGTQQAAPVDPAAQPMARNGMKFGKPVFKK